MFLKSNAATRRACHTGFFVQAIVNNLAPLLFIVFQDRYDLPIEQLGRLVLLNFGTQLVTDLVAVKVVDRIGYRIPMVAAHLLATLGLILLGIAPDLVGDPFLGLSLAIIVYAIGGGLLEVIVSPIVDALPSPKESKAADMALLHSFYCWGQLAVVVGSTLVLVNLGHDAWKILPMLWAMVPAVNMLVFLRVPLPDTVPDEHRTSIRKLFRAPTFLAALTLMLTGGAAELTMSQWSSFFAEQGLGVPKVMGDLLGPGVFALLMGTGRFAYGMWGRRLALAPTLIGCAALGAVCYFVAALSPSTVVSLIGCSMCGLAVSLLWPGTFSLTAARFPLGGAAMFGLLAVAGDGGGAIGPWVAGAIADATAAPGFLGDLAAMLPADGGSGLRVGLLFGAILPLVFTIVVARLAYTMRNDPVVAGI